MGPPVPLDRFRERRTTYQQAASTPILLNPGDDRLYRLSQLEEMSATVNEYSDDLWQQTIRNADDVIIRSTISIAQGQQYWVTFFWRCSHRLGWALDFKNVVQVRQEAPLLFAAICAVGAQVLGEDDEARRCLDTAKELSQGVVFVDELPGHGTSLGDLKGLLIMCIFFSMPRLVGAIASLNYHMSLHTVFAKLTDPDLRGATEEETLIRKGRLWLLSYIYVNLSCIMLDQPALFLTPPDLIVQHCEILRTSALSYTELDACYALHAELVALLTSVQKSTTGLPLARRFSVVHEHSNKLDQWWQRWNQGEGGAFATKDLSYFSMALQSARAFIHKFGYAPLSDGRDILNVPEALESTRIAYKNARDVLQTVAEQNSGAPSSFGLAVDFDAISTPLCTTTCFEVALALPGTVDLTDLINIIQRLAFTYYSADISPQHDAINVLSIRLASLAAAATVPDSVAASQMPQRIDLGTRQYLNQLGTSATFYDGVFSEAMP